MTGTVRRPHAVLDLPSRRWKGEKILRLLELEPLDRPWRVLEIGTGTGGIAHYLGSHPLVRCDVVSVDVADLRLQADGYRFELVRGTALPFDDASFDVVISNHVIEHVGERVEQLAHLHECHRVLVPQGRGYLAVPNRWMLVEPHYRLVFLSWLPRSWRTPYLRLLGKGDFYDCEPPSLLEIEAMFRQADLAASNLTVRALRETFDIEGTAGVARRFAARLPDALYERLLAVFPTLIFRFRRAQSGAGPARDVPPR